MDREYKAFISYRHLPLEMEVAKNLHRRIERYVIPKALRKDGQKKLGLVFRDQDELPISSNLSENIRMALDAAEYLIVICTPETEKSLWVLREISYFLEHHDRDHVLAVLADGTPETAFPPALTELRSESGDLLERIEPLAANIVAESARKRRALFRTESLRILATLIGCPFDALYRREQRYRRRRTAGILSAAALLAAAFIAMLLNRNAQIRKQLLLTQENESMVLAQLAESEYEKGNYHGAVEYAVRALPSEAGERPYVARAEWQLGQILLPYRQGGMAYDQSMEQDTEIQRLALSEDGKLVFTADEFGCVRCFDTYSGSLLWQHDLGAEDSLGGSRLMPLPALNALLHWDRDARIAGVYEERSGKAIWQQDDILVVAVQAESGTILCLEKGENYGDRKLTLRKAADCQILNDVLLPGYSSDWAVCGALSPGGRYAAAMLYGSLQIDDWNLDSIQVWDLESGTLTEIDQRDYDLSVSRYLAFTEQEHLLFAYDSWDEGGETCCFDPDNNWARCWTTPTRSADSYLEIINGKILMSGEISVLQDNGDGILVGGLFALTRLDKDTGEVQWRKNLKTQLVTLIPLNGTLNCVMTGDGTFTTMTDTGDMGVQARIRYFSAEYPLKTGALAGESFKQTTAALVAADYPNRISIVHWRDAALPVAMPEADQLQEYLRWESSPSGNYLAVAAFDYDAHCIAGEVWDLVSGEKVRSFSVPSEISRFREDFALTEDGVLIADGCALDTKAERLANLSGQEELPGPYRIETISAKERKSGKTLSAILCRDADEAGYPLLLWEDGRQLLAETRAFSEYLPDFSGEPHLAAVGAEDHVLVKYTEWGEDRAEHYALYSAENDSWIALPDLEGTAFAMAESSPVLAVQKRSGVIALYDADSGRLLREIEHSLPPLSVTKMLFHKEDKELLLFTSTGSLAVFELETGEKLHQSSFSQFGLSFHSDARYDVYEQEEDGKLIIVYDYDGYTEPELFLIDRKSWECCGGYMGVACYVPATDELILAPYMEGVHHMPRLDTEDLRQLALDFLDRRPIE